MPIYEFRCSACDEITSVIKSKPDPESANPGRCPKCDTWQSLELVLGGSKLLFKGTGFHTTDYPTQKRFAHKAVVGMGTKGK